MRVTRGNSYMLWLRSSSQSVLTTQHFNGIKMFLVNLFQQKYCIPKKKNTNLPTPRIIQLIFSKTILQINMQHDRRVAVLLIRSLPCEFILSLPWVGNQACFQPSSKYTLNKIYLLVIYNYYQQLLNHERETNSCYDRTGVLFLQYKVSIG